LGGSRYNAEKMRRTLLPHVVTLTLLAAVAIPVTATQGVGSGDKEAGIILDNGISYVLSAPDGWVLDTTSGAQQGLAAVFYPQGSSWSAGRTVMYARVVEKRSGRRTLQGLVDADVREFRAASRRSTARSGLPLRTRNGQQAIVRYFFDGQNTNSEAVAYIDTPKAVVLLVLSSRTRQSYAAALPAFKQLVGSYALLGEKIY
jgi:hypothetical protein